MASSEEDILEFDYLGMESWFFHFFPACVTADSSARFEHCFSTNQIPNTETISMSDVLELDMFNNTDSVYVQTSQGQEINFSALDIKSSPPGEFETRNFRSLKHCPFGNRLIYRGQLGARAPRLSVYL